MNIKRIVSVISAVLLFAALLIYPQAASQAALSGLKMCAQLILPSLFPFFVATTLLSELGVTRRLGKVFAPVCEKLFNVSGNGGTAFIIGITAGYPLGAAYISGMRKRNEISKEEAERLLIFCNNSGPAFIIGAAGTGVFSSAAAGLFLYAIHIIAALAGGIIFAPKVCFVSDVKASDAGIPSFATALTNAVKSSVAACISVSGFIVAFSVLTGILDYSGVFSSLIGFLSASAGTELHWSRALLCGIIELGNGIGSMSGLTAGPLSLALAAFILGWGGISVHFQTFAMLDGTDIKTARYIIGRFVIALIGSALALFGAILIF